MSTVNNSNDQPEKIPIATCFLVAYDQLVAKLKSIGQLGEQICDFLRRNGRVILLSASIAAVLLFQTGCSEVIETGWVLFWGEDKSNAWKKLDLPNKVNLALDTDTPNSTLKAMGQDAKLVNYLLNEVQNYNKEKADDWQQAMNALNRMRFPSQTYNKLYLDKNAYLRNVVACNHYSPPDLLRVLAKDEYNAIRKNVAYNEVATPESIIMAMGQDAKSVNYFLNKVRTYNKEKEDEWQQAMRVLKRMQFPRETYNKLYLDKNGNVRSVVACNHYSPPSLLEDLAKDKDETVRMNVASNPVAPIDVLESLHKDTQDEVVEKVHSNSTWQKYIVGTPHDKYLNVVWAENGRFRPADGYGWVSDPPSEQKFRVRFMPNIKKDIFGNIYPADGYCWMSDDPWGKHDFHVKHIPGTPHEIYTNVVWAENGEFCPAPGYDWVNKDDPEDFRVKQIFDDSSRRYWESESMRQTVNDLVKRQNEQHRAYMKRITTTPPIKPWHNPFQ